MNYRFHSPIILLFLILIGPSTFGQLTDWSSKTTLIIQNTDSTARTNFSHLIYFDSATPIANGEMASNGADIRVALDCDGTTIVPHYLESGIGTSTTKLWALIPSIPARGSDTIFIFHGNRNAADTSDFDATFPSQLILSDIDALGAVITDSVWEYNYIKVASGANIQFNPSNALPWKLRMHAGKIEIDGNIDGTAFGYEGVVSGTGGGPGGGKTVTTGAGGGYGGDGGRSSYYNATPSNGGDPGLAYGTTNLRDIDAGSAGGAAGLTGGGTPGGSGGISFIIEAYEVDIKGEIISDGQKGFDGVTTYSSGGGSGGGVYIKAHNLNVSGQISVKGGNGGNSDVIFYGGGGGGGGRIKLFHSNEFSFTGSTILKGGFYGLGGPDPASPGEDGTFYEEATSNELSTVTVIPKPILNTPPTPYCRNSDILITAPAIGSNYNFFVNGTSVQTSPSNTYIFNSNFPVNSIWVDITIGTCVERTKSIPLNLLDSPEPSISTVGVFTGFCPGDSVQLNVDNTDNNNFRWIKDGVAVLIGDEISPYFKSPGSYIISDTNTAGCVGNSEAIIISQFKAPTTEIDLASNTFCSGDSLLVKIKNLGDSTAQWSEAATLFSEKDSVFIKTEAVFSVQLFSPEGCAGTSVAFSTTITDTPTLDITSDFGSFVCPANAAKLSRTGGPTANSLLWMKDGVSLPAEVTENLSTSNPGTYTLTETNPIGCTGVSNAVTIQEFGPFTIQAPSSLTFCAGSNIVFETTLDPELTYTWFLDGNPYSTLRPDSVVFNTSGTVHLKIDNGFGCVDQSADYTVTETPIPTGTILFANGNAFCPGESLDISTDYSGNISWQKNGALMGVTTAVLTLTEAGDYSAILEPNGLCEGSTNTLTVTLRDAPEKGSISQSNDSLFTNETADGYQWYLNGTLVPNATEQFITDLVLGNYTVQLFNEFNCGSTISEAYAYDPNGLFEIGAKSQYSLFPNPSNGIINISGDVVKVQVFNANGQEFLSQAKTNSQTNLEIKIPQNGIYFVQLILLDGSINYEKMVVQ